VAALHGSLAIRALPGKGVQRVWIIHLRQCDAERIGITRGTRWERVAKLEKEGTGSSLNTKVTYDKPMVDKEIAPQAKAIGHFYL